MGVKTLVCCWSVAPHSVAGCTASRVCRRACSGGDSSATDVALSCWYLYSVAVMSLSAVCITDALKYLWHSDGLLPVKAVLVIVQVSLDGLGVSVLLLMMLGSCCRSAWRVGCGTVCGMRDVGIVVDHRTCLLARSSKPYAAEQKVGRVTVNE